MPGADTAAASCEQAGFVILWTGSATAPAFVGSTRLCVPVTRQGVLVGAFAERAAACAGAPAGGVVYEVATWTLVDCEKGG